MVHHVQRTPAEPRSIRWDAMAAIIASLIGFLALLVGAYTAWVERYTADIQLQQVRAQVWPYLLLGNNDLQSSLEIYSRGVGPALVDSVQFRIDGKPQRDWGSVLETLGLPPHGFQASTLADNVLSPGGQITWVKFRDATTYKHLMEAFSRIEIQVCYCSSLGDCWETDSVSNRSTRVGTSCPVLEKPQLFID
jgi:hypothetical protein